MTMLENLGQRLFDAGQRTTTWFNDAGDSTMHGTFNPTVRLFDEQGTEIPGALQQRMGMPAGLTDFQPGFGHAQRQALFADIVQRALDAGWFAKLGIPAGPRVNGGTKASGFNPEFLQDVAYLLTAERASSDIVKRFADGQPPFDGPPQKIPASLPELFAKHKHKFPSRHTPLEFTPAELAAAGVAPTEEGLDFYYDYVAQALLFEIKAGTTDPNAGPAGPNYSFATVDVATFLRWWRGRQAGSQTTAKATAGGAAGPVVAASKRADGTEVWSVQAEGLDREGLIALAQSILGKALGVKS
jgi:hypothetical protein